MVMLLIPYHHHRAQRLYDHPRHPYRALVCFFPFLLALLPIISSLIFLFFHIVLDHPVDLQILQRPLPRSPR